MKKVYSKCFWMILSASVLISVLFVLAGCTNILSDNGNGTDPGSELDMMLAPDTLPAGSDVGTHEDRVILEQQRIEYETEQHALNGPSRSLTNGTYSFDEKIDVSKTMTGIVIYDNTYAKAEIIGGGISFQPGFHFESTISSGSLKSAKAYIYNTVTGNPQYKITLKGNYEKTYAKNLYSWSQTYFTLVSGVVPAWVTFKIQIDGGCYTKAAASGWVTSGISAKSYVQIGAQWTSTGGWSNISSVSPTWGYYAPSFGYTADLTVQPYINVFLSAYLYSLLGPRCLVTPYLTLGMNLANRTYTLDATLRGHIYFDLNGLEQSTIWDTDVFSKTYRVKSGSF